MPPREHSCIQCRSGLSVSDVSDGSGVFDVGDGSDASDVRNVTCPSCAVEYRAEPAEEGVRVYPRGGEQSLTELRLATLRGFAEENGLVA